MRRPNLTRVLGVGVAALVAAFALTGCVTRMTGGGWMLSADGVSKATFAVNFEVLDDDGDEIPDTGRIQGTYHDHGLGVRFKFEDFVPITAGGFEDPDCIGGLVTYEPQDPALRGAKGHDPWHVALGACDRGEPGAGEGDSLVVQVIDGPYAGYFNEGPILGGNFQAHEFSD